MSGARSNEVRGSRHCLHIWLRSTKQAGEGQYASVLTEFGTARRGLREDPRCHAGVGSCQQATPRSAASATSPCATWDSVSLSGGSKAQ